MNRLASVYYEGTSAYKIEEYYSYTSDMRKKQEEKAQKQIKQKTANRKKIIVAISAAFVVAVTFLFLNVVLLQASATYSQSMDELEDLKMRNAQLSFDVASGVDLNAVETKAKTQFGMQRPESYQNVYVNVVQNDYTETFVEEGSGMGFVERMIISLKSFLTYIG